MKLFHQHLRLPRDPHPGEKPQPSSTQPVLGKAEQAPRAGQEGGSSPKNAPRQ